MKRECIICKEKDILGKSLEAHHLIPKFIGGKDVDGRILLCKKHHDELHKMINERFAYEIKEFSLNWIQTKIFRK